MTKKSLSRKPIQLNIDFIEWFRDLKIGLSKRDKKTYSDQDLSIMLLKMPELDDIKKRLLDQNINITTQIRIQMDRRRNE